MSVNNICKTHNITHGSVIAKCDGEGTINILQWMHVITKNSRKYYNIILAIQKVIEISPITWNFVHLKGHKDKYISYSQLDRWAQLNVLVDMLVKREVTRVLNEEGQQGSTLSVPYNMCRIFW